MDACTPYGLLHRKEKIVRVAIYTVHGTAMVMQSHGLKTDMNLVMRIAHWRARSQLTRWQNLKEGISIDSTLSEGGTCAKQTRPSRRVRRVWRFLDVLLRPADGPALARARGW